MAAISFRTATLVAVIAAILYRTYLRDLLTTLGVSRVMQPITDFPYQCRRIHDDSLQACEDMWLDEASRQLFLACSDVRSRQHWLPTMGKLNASARPLNDRVVVLDIDHAMGPGYRQRILAASGFPGTVADDGSLHVMSISGRRIPDTDRVELYIVNTKPSIALHSGQAIPTVVDDMRTPANFTVELFEVETGSSAGTMHHIRTFSHPLIATPNNVAVKPDGTGFYISNDHGLHKTGFRHHASPLLFTGNVVHCSTTGITPDMEPECHVVATGLSFPNGLTIDPSDPRTLYVPSAALGGGVTIYRMPSFRDPSYTSGTLTKVTHLPIPYPIDNLSPSPGGSIFAAAFPKTFQSLRAFDDPATFMEPTIANAKIPPSAILKIDKVRNLVNDGHEMTWKWEKVLEDAHGAELPATTVAVRDDKTGRLFISGIISYFITVCEPNES